MSPNTLLILLYFLPLLILGVILLINFLISDTEEDTGEDSLVLPPPNNIKYDLANGQIFIEWDKVSKAAGYAVIFGHNSSLNLDNKDCIITVTDNEIYYSIDRLPLYFAVGSLSQIKQKNVIFCSPKQVLITKSVDQIDCSYRPEIANKDLIYADIEEREDTFSVSWPANSKYDAYLVNDNNKIKLIKDNWYISRKDNISVAGIKYTDKIYPRFKVKNNQLVKTDQKGFTVSPFTQAC